MINSNLQESIARQREILKGWLSSSLASAPLFGFTNPWFYALRAGYVWDGIMLPATSSVSTTKNKSAINAEMSARGFATIP